MSSAKAISCAVSTLATLLIVGSLKAQPTVYSQSQHVHLGGPSGYRHGWCDPLHSLTTRVFAEADLVRAKGGFLVNAAAARQIHANSFSTELANREEAVDSFWRIKQIHARRKLELDQLSQLRKGLHQNHLKWRNARKWEWINNLQGGATAENLNFVLSRLSRTLLADDLETPKLFSDEMLRQLTLERKTLTGLKMKTATHSGVYLRFNPEEPHGMLVERWPFLLRGEDVASQRTAFEAVRDKAIEESESSGLVSQSTLARLESALSDLSGEFHRQQKVRDWVKKEHRRYSQFRAAERFLIDLDRQVVRIQNTGDSRAYRGRIRYDADVHGQHLLGLLRFMADSGLEFDEPSPGEEDAYDVVLRKMRSMYRLVALQDAGLQPTNLTEGI